MTTETQETIQDEAVVQNDQQEPSLPETPEVPAPVQDTFKIHQDIDAESESLDSAADDISGDAGEASDEIIPDDEQPDNNQANLMRQIAQQQLGLSDEDAERFSGMNGLEALLHLTSMQQQAPAQQPTAQPAPQGNGQPAQQPQGPQRFTFPWEQEGQSLDASDWDEDTAKVLTAMRDHHEQQLAPLVQAVEGLLGYANRQQQQSQVAEFNKMLDGVSADSGLKEKLADPAIRQAVFSRYQNLRPLLEQNGVRGQQALEMVLAMSTGNGLQGMMNNVRQATTQDIKAKLSKRSRSGMLNPSKRSKQADDPTQKAVDVLNALNPRGAFQ